jgi:outer membrane murein-binding lipoprotein Lpp
MKRRVHIHTAFAAAFVLLLSGCASPEKLVDTGNYDQAIEIAVRRLAGKKKIKDKYVDALEEAFAKANSRDLATADRLKRTGRSDYWPRIYRLYRDIRQRQERVAGLLPLADEYGIRADFRFVKIEELEREAKEQAALHYYDYGLELLQAARSGDRLAAREAYEQLDKTRRYFQRFREVDAFQQEALNIGTTYILVDLENQSRRILPQGLDRALLGLRENDLNSKWRVFHTSADNRVNYDYKVVLELVDLAVSPGRVKEREFQEVREIEDGWQYVLDERGNVAKDSLGNDIKEPRYVKIGATVLEHYQAKEASILGRMSFYDMARDRVLDVREVRADALFENYAATFRGDERALSKESKRLIGNRPIPFPTDIDMLLQAADRLKPEISQNLSRTNVIR